MKTTNNYQKGDKDVRPWGTWEVLNSGSGYCIKQITVHPGKKLSLQVHQHRDEKWIIVQGHAVVTLGSKDCRRDAFLGDVISIPKQVIHRIQNPGSHELVFIEIQSGDILDENDITRLEDEYGRL